MEYSSEAKKSRGPAHWLRRLANNDFGLFLTIFTLLSVVACFPILLHPARHLSAAPLGDKGTNLWNLWWIYYALFERGISPLRCDMIFIPWGCDLRYHTLSIANGLLASPVTAWFGPSVAYNLLFVLWTALTGCFAAMWARQFGAGRAVAALTGVIAAFGPYRWSHQIHLNLFSTAWMFLAFYLCERSLRRRSVLLFLGIVAAWLLAFFSDWYYGLFIGGYFGVRFGVQLLKDRDWKTASSGLCFFAAPCAIVGSVLFFYFHSSNALEGYVDPVTLKFAAFWSMDFMHFLVPLWLLPQFPQLPQSGEFWFHPGVVMILLPLVFWRWAGASVESRWNRKILLFLAIIFLILSFGPVLICSGRSFKLFGLPVFLPAGVFELIPALTVIRVYARFAYPGFLAYLLFGLLGLQHWIDQKGFRWGTRIACLFLSMTFLLETRWSFPVMVEHEPPPILIPDTPKPVLELPFTPSVFGGLHLYHQTLHEQPIFVAEFSRLGNYRRRYLEAFPVLGLLNRAAIGESPFNGRDVDLDAFCAELKHLGAVHFVLTIPETYKEKSDLIRGSMQNLLRECYGSSENSPLLVP